MTIDGAKALAWQEDHRRTQRAAALAREGVSYFDCEFFGQYLEDVPHYLEYTDCEGRRVYWLERYEEWNGQLLGQQVAWGYVEN